jgi:transposase InsO family protein
LRQPIEFAQYTSIDYTQTLADHGVLASVGSVGDAFDNALAQSFVDSFKTELIADRVLRTRAQLELAVVEYMATIITSSRKLVPQRGWKREKRAAFSGVSASPAS